FGWWFHIRGVDRAGNWGPAEHLGPFLIDTIPPKAELVPESVPEVIIPTVPFHLAMIISDESDISKVMIDLTSINGPKDYPMTKEAPDKWGCDITVPEGIMGKKDLIITALDMVNNVSTATVTINMSSPKITSLLPTFGTIGTIVMLKGEGYLPSEQIQIDFGTTRSITVSTSDSYGSFTATFKVDSQGYGLKTITATGLESDGIGTSIFQVINPKITSVLPTSGTIGTKVTIKGEGYLASESIRIDFGTILTIGLTTADAQGSFMTIFKIDLPDYGTKTIIATGLTSNEMAMATFYLLDKTPPIISNPRARPKIAFVNNTLVKFTATVTDTGCGVDSVIINLTPINDNTNQQMFDDGTNGDERAKDGIYTYKILISNSALGGIKSLVVTARDKLNNLSQGTITLQVINPKITLVSPASGIIGTEVTVKGEGYFASELIRI
ncbi:MAG: IPT/TIG domain-containing protein, partial [bacterium]